MQHYNALLSLSKLSTASDANILFENEVAYNICQKVKCIDRPTLYDINSVIVSHLLPLLLPKSDLSTPNNYNKDIADDVRMLCCHPSYKFLDVKMTPQSSNKAIEYNSDSWSSLLITINRLQQQPRGTLQGSHTSSGSSSAYTGQEYTASNVKSLGSVVTYHGIDSYDACSHSSYDNTGGHNYDHSYNASNRESISKLASPRVMHNRDKNSIQPLYYTAPHHTLLTSDPVQFYHTPYRSQNYDRSISLLSNNSTCLPVLHRILHRAGSLFSSQAYVHQYARYGLGRLDFTEALEAVAQITDCYSRL